MHHTLSAIDPAKNRCYVASLTLYPSEWEELQTLRGGVPGAPKAAKLAQLLARLLRLEIIEWPSPAGVARLCRLWGEGLGTGYVLCEAQWAGADAQDKWTGLQALLHTAGALRCCAAMRGYSDSSVELQRGHATGVDVTGRRDLLGFVAPGHWRSVSLAPRPCRSREQARATERACAVEMLGRDPGPDLAAASGILLAALGLNYSEIGVRV